VPFIDGGALASWLADRSRPAPVVVDVRSPSERGVSMLPARSARTTAPPRRGAATLDPAVPIVVYCAGGMRSAKAARVLIAAGHGDVRNLEGGIFAWANDGPAAAVRRPRDALRASERREVGRVARARPARMDADAA
jgi:adenylyltransferase/sulfurtransferase